MFGSSFELSTQMVMSILSTDLLPTGSKSAIAFGSRICAGASCPVSTSFYIDILSVVLTVELRTISNIPDERIHMELLGPGAL